MNNKAQGNSQWIARVMIMIGNGFGVEDIAIRTESDIADVRREVSILREDGILEMMFPRNK